MFDGRAVRRPPYRRLVAEAWSLAAYRPTRPRPEELPDGAGCPVLVIPAFLTGDAFTAGLRRFLCGCGFHAFGWGLGLNWGPTPRLLEGLDRGLSVIRREHGPVALLGISLGGVLARNLACERPQDISHVATVASPFRLPTASTLEPLVRLCARRYSPAVQPARLLAPMATPTTMIYTRDDGVVAPESCWTEQDGGAVVELGGAHLTLASNPDALRAIVRRLAPDGR